MKPLLKVTGSQQPCSLVGFLSILYKTRLSQIFLAHGNEDKIAKVVGPRYAPDHTRRQHLKKGINLHI